MFRYSRARALVLGATTLAALGAIDVQALPYNAHAGYEVDGTTVPLPGQSSATDVDILEFTTVNNLGVGIHAYGAGGSFGSRASANFFGPASLAVVDSLFTLDLAGLGASLTLDVTPGEIAVRGLAGGMAVGDFLSSRLQFHIEVDGVSVYDNIISAGLDHTSANAGEFLDPGNTVALNLGLTCGSSFVGGTASCIIGGGATPLNLDALAGHGGPHTLLYTLFAEASGEISAASGCGGGFGGGGEVATALLINGDGGGNGGGNQCSAIARSGDPVPEPATFVLAPLAIAGAAVVRRRQRRAA